MLQARQRPTLRVRENRHGGSSWASPHARFAKIWGSSMQIGREAMLVGTDPQEIAPVKGIDHCDSRPAARQEAIARHDGDLPIDQMATARHQRCLEAFIWSRKNGENLEMLMRFPRVDQMSPGANFRANFTLNRPPP